MFHELVEKFDKQTDNTVEFWHSRDWFQFVAISFVFLVLKTIIVKKIAVWSSYFVFFMFFYRLWSRVVTTRTSQDKTRPSSRLDSEGEEEEEDTDKVRNKYLVQLGWRLLNSLNSPNIVIISNFRSLFRFSF